MYLSKTQVCPIQDTQQANNELHSWPLDRVHEPSFDRPNLHVTVKDWKKEGGPWYCYDDEIKLNTQSGSQWDGLRRSFMDELLSLATDTMIGHWGHSVTGMYYNGIPHESVLDTSHLGVEREFHMHINSYPISTQVC